MKVIKVTGNVRRDISGYWCLSVQILVGRTYKYAVLMYETEKEALGVKAGDNIDPEKVKWTTSPNIVQL